MTETRYEGCEPSGSLAQDLLTEVFVVSAAQHATSAESDLYFIQVAGGGPVKIGISSDVRKRLDGLRTSCPYPLELRRTVRRMGLLERPLHAQLAAARLRGEWFEPTPDVLAVVDGPLATEGLLSQAPSLLGVSWYDAQRFDYDRFVQANWEFASASSLWSGCQLHVHWAIARHGTIGRAYEAALAEDARCAA